MSITAEQIRAVKKSLDNAEYECMKCGAFKKHDDLNIHAYKVWDEELGQYSWICVEYSCKDKCDKDNSG